MCSFGIYSLDKQKNQTCKKLKAVHEQRRLLERCLSYML